MKTMLLCAYAAVTLAVSLALTDNVRAQVITPNPDLPVLYPDGYYRTPDQIHATYNGPGLVIVLSNVQHRAVALINRIPVGPDEREQFDSDLLGLISANGSSFFNTTANGPVDTMVYGKVGNTTGTFQTEMLAMSLSGTSPFGPYMVRESPTLPSLGQTTITNIGGGLFHIDSFFDVFTELSIDGGQTWIPSQGSTHVDLVTPEPSVLALVGLGAGLLALRRIQKRV